MKRVMGNIFRALAALEKKLLCYLRRIKLAFSPSNLQGNLRISDDLMLNVPLRCDGRGKVEIGRNVTLGYPLAPYVGNGEILIQARETESVVIVGDNTVFSNNISIISCGSISIGKDCLIGNNVLIIDSDFHEINPNIRKNGTGFIAPVEIGDNVWLGIDAIILKGVEIGDNSVVGAGSVVSKNIPANVVAAGNPAVVIRDI